MLNPQQYKNRTKKVDNVSVALTRADGWGFGGEGLWTVARLTSAC